MEYYNIHLRKQNNIPHPQPLVGKEEMGELHDSFPIICILKASITSVIYTHVQILSKKKDWES